MEEVTYRIVGEPGEPLIMHNSQLANPLNEFTKAIKELTPKLKKTDQQHADIARLEWRGGLYWNESDGPYLPGLNVRRALLDAARLSKQGKTIERGLLRIARVCPLQYDGPRDIEGLWADERFRHTAIVVNPGNRARITRTRPCFMDWSATVSITVDPNMINPRNLLAIAEAAGTYIGIGDGRPFFGGRFSVEEL